MEPKTRPELGQAGPEAAGSGPQKRHWAAWPKRPSTGRAFWPKERRWPASWLGCREDCGVRRREENEKRSENVFSDIYRCFLPNSHILF
jgi:hypothetical protein